MEIPPIVKSEVVLVKSVVASLAVTSPDEADHASEVLHKIKEAQKLITSQKEEITRPLMASLAKVKDLFKPFELDLAEADKAVRAALTAYRVAEEEKVEKEKAKIVEKVEKGTMRADTAVTKLSGVGSAPKTKGVSTTTRRVLEIIDESIIPREYLVPDRVAITKALFADVPVPGARLKEEKSVRLS